LRLRRNLERGKTTIIDTLPPNINLLSKIRSFFDQIIKKIPSPHQWSQFFKILDKKEFYLFLLFFSSLIISSSLLIYQWYFNKTEIRPIAYGKYTEALVETPRYLNPVLSGASDTDRDISYLIYSSLMKYDNNGQLISDLIDKYDILDDGKTYRIEIKRNIKWHDSKPLTTDDILFTIDVIQNADYKSPLRINWLGVETEKIDDFIFQIKLKNPYSPFLHNLTFGILPKHIWKDISAANFPLDTHNLHPIGSGPYKIKNLSKDKKTGAITSLKLEAYAKYHFHRPNIKVIEFKFYKSESAAIEAFNQKKVDAIGLSSTSIINQIKKNKSANLYSFNLPRYFAIFFNQEKNKLLSDKNLRLALNYATNKKEIIKSVLDDNGLLIDSPIPSNLSVYNQNIKKYEFDLEKAKNLLSQNGWKDIDEDGIREKEFAVDKKTKETIKLEIIITTTEKQELIDIAELLKKQWLEAGVKVNIETKEIFDLQQNYIKPREYEALLFGEVLSINPDPFAFWHSSQKKDNGLNLSLYTNKSVDKLLEEMRQDSNQNTRAEKFIKFQNLVVEDAPVIFLYSPLYFFAVDKNIKGINESLITSPTGRFNNIDNWYIKTKRAWK